MTTIVYTAEAHAKRMAELEQRLQDAVAATNRSLAWASNLVMQNRQDENIPETIISGTADESAGTLSDDQRRRGRGSLATNLGLIA